MNGMNSAIKRREIAEWSKNHNPTICFLQKTHLKKRDTNRVNAKSWSSIYYASADVKKAGVAILISDKAKAEIDLIKRDIEGNYILLKGIINNEEISLLNMCAPSGIASRFLEERVGGVEGRNRQQYYISGGSQPPPL